MEEEEEHYENVLDEAPQKYQHKVPILIQSHYKKLWKAEVPQEEERDMAFVKKEEDSEFNDEV